MLKLSDAYQLEDSKIVIFYLLCIAELNKNISFDLPHLLWDSPSSKPQYGWLLINYITISFSFTVTVAVHVSPSHSTVYTMEIDSWSRIYIIHCSTYTCNTTVSSLYSRLPVIHLQTTLCLSICDHWVLIDDVQCIYIDSSNVRNRCDI